MALDTNTVTKLYQTYFGRTPTADELGQITSGQGQYARYNTPQTLERLLKNTSSSLKGSMEETINNNIQNLKGGSPAASQNLLYGKLPDYNTYQAQNPDMQSALMGYNAALDQSSEVNQQAAAAPSAARGQLKAGSYFFGESYADLMKRFGDQSSPWYVSDPQLRERVLDDAVTKRSATMSDAIQKITDIYSVLKEASANTLAGQRDKLDLLTKTIGKSYDTMLAYYGEQEAERRAIEADKRQHQYRMQEIAASKSGSGGDLATLIGKKKAAAASAGYIAKLKADGGYDYFGPDGKPITVEQYASDTGMSVLDALEGSRAKQDIIQNLPQQAKTALSGIQAAKFAVQELKRQSEEVNVGRKLTAPIRGLAAWGGKTVGLSNTSRAYDSWRNANASVLARGMFAEKGTLTDKDVDRARNAMPSLSDNKTIAAQKIALLEEAIRNQEDKIVSIWTGTGGLGGSVAPSVQTMQTPDGKTWVQNPDGTLEEM